jgi:Dolichyl-phosphate-mannose-protein mannosyltransferase
MDTNYSEAKNGATVGSDIEDKGAMGVEQGGSRASFNRAPMTARVEQGIQLCWWIVLAVVIVVVVSIRIHLLAIPLERDEGEYAYAGQLMLQGIPPYQLAYNMKFPGVYAAYALIMWIFGQSSTGIHVGLLIVNIATIVIVFLIARRLTGLAAGIAAAASYAILSASASVLGLAAHATHFVMLPILLGALVLLKPVLTKKMVFVSGILFGAGLLMKQPAIFFICFGAVYLLFRDWRAKLTFSQTLLRIALFATGSVLPLAVTAFWLWRAGVLAKFWFWTVAYAREYASVISISQGSRIFSEQIGTVIGLGWLLWALAALGVAVSFLDKAMRKSAFFILTFMAFSGLALSSGFLFRRHYFVFVLPAICLLVGVATATASSFCSRLARPLLFLPLAIFVVCSRVALSGQLPLLSQSPSDVVRMIYGPNPFSEAVRVAEYLREHTDPNDTIAILGSEPEIYFYAHRHSATGYIYTYPLMEPQRYAVQMQREMMREIEAARPKYLVFISVTTSWLKHPNSKTEIFEWFDKYSAADFQLDGLVNIVSSEQTGYYLPLSVDQQSSRPSEYYLLIYKRKT